MKGTTMEANHTGAHARTHLVDGTCRPAAARHGRPSRRRRLQLLPAATLTALLAVVGAASAGTAPHHSPTAPTTALAAATSSPAPGEQARTTALAENALAHRSALARASRADQRPGTAAPVRPGTAPRRPVAAVASVAAGTTHGPARFHALAATSAASAQADNLAAIHAVWPESLWDQAVAVASCESHLRNVRGTANADGTHDWGLFQLNDGGTLQGLGGTPAMALNPLWNAHAALRLFHQRGWQSWTCGRTLGLA